MRATLHRLWHDRPAWRGALLMFGVWLAYDLTPFRDIAPRSALTVSVAPGRAASVFDTAGLIARFGAHEDAALPIRVTARVGTRCAPFATDLRSPSSPSDVARRRIRIAPTRALRLSPERTSRDSRSPSEATTDVGVTWRASTSTRAPDGHWCAMGPFE